MNADSAVQLIRDALMMTFWLAAPLLVVGFTASIVISLVQIVTSIQDTTFNTVPRLAAAIAALALSMPWMLHKAMVYATSILGNLSRYGK